MTELARFFGIIIRMYVEPGSPHHHPHFHAYYQNNTAVFGIDPIEMFGGKLPRKQQRLSKHEQNSIKVNCWRTGNAYNPVTCPIKLPHYVGKSEK